MKKVSKSVTKNTLMLYIRQIIKLLISLYTVRVVLNVLGAEDYGIYNVIGGFVALFSFFSGAMASATQRFFSYSIGNNNKDELNKLFIVNLIIYLSIAAFAFILLETIGVWFVYNKLSIPVERVSAVRIVFHFSVLTFIFSIYSSPFMALIIAHEDMQIYAVLSIAESVIKVILLLIFQYLPVDKLILYSILLSFVALVNALFFCIYCLKKYDECQLRKFYWDKEIFRKLTSFIGWTLFGYSSSMIRNQAITVLLNQTFSPVVVAARTIAIRISGKINLFSNNFNIGLYPPIIKSYATKQKNRMFNLIYNGCKITFFLMWIFTLPMLLEMEYILNLWLKKPPLGSVLFTRLVLIEMLINSLSLPLTTAARAPGKMRLYESILGTIQILIFVVSWILLKLSYPAYSVFVVAIIANVVMFFIRLLILKYLIDLSLNLFYMKVIIPIMIITALSLLPTITLHYVLSQTFLNVIIIFIVSIVFSGLCMYFIGIGEKWRKKINIFVYNKFNQLKMLLFK